MPTWDGGHRLAGKTHLREDGGPGRDGCVLREVGVAHELMLPGKLDEDITHIHTYRGLL